MRAYGDSIYETISVIAVEIFFPLSGFVLGRQINFIIKSRRGYAIFLMRRWMRTLPPYLVGLFAITVLLGEPFDINLLHYIFFSKYLFPEYSLGNYFPIAWSLAVEEWYYIAFPAFLLGLSYFFPRPKHLLAIALGFTCIIFFAKLMAADVLTPSFLRIFSFFRLDAICLGYIFFLAFARAKLSITELLILPTTMILIATLLLTQKVESSSLSTVLVFSFLPVFFAGVISIIAKLETLGALRFYGIWEFVGLWLGRLSYAIYIFHLVILYVLSSYPSWNDLLTYLAALSIFCTLFYFFFEKPIMSARPSYKESAMGKSN
jgi:peptidoglycan/LPS O-acetylase OafA/YrhL